MSNQVDDKHIRVIQQVVGYVLYYLRPVDFTVLKTLSSIASEQTLATENTKKKVTQLLDYLATKPNVKIRFYAFGMIKNIHLDALYLSESQARSRVAGHYFMGSVPT